MAPQLMAASVRGSNFAAQCEFSAATSIRWDSDESRHDWRRGGAAPEPIQRARRRGCRRRRFGPAERQRRCGRQARRRKGLGEVVVSAGIEPVNDVMLLIQRGEHDDRGTARATAEILDNRISAFAGKADVEYDGLEEMLFEQPPAILRAPRRLDRMALFRKADAKKLRHARVIFDDEDAEEIAAIPFELFPARGRGRSSYSRPIQGDSSLISGLFYKLVTGY